MDASRNMSKLENTVKTHHKYGELAVAGPAHGTAEGRRAREHLFPAGELTQVFIIIVIVIDTTSTKYII
jgi:hypothetical protein